MYSVLCPTKRTVMALKRVALERCDQETITNYMNEVALLNRLRGHDRIIQLMECQVLRSGSGRPKTLQMVGLTTDVFPMSGPWSANVILAADGVWRDRLFQLVG